MPSLGNIVEIDSWLRLHASVTVLRTATTRNPNKAELKYKAPAG